MLLPLLLLLSPPLLLLLLLPLLLLPEKFLGYGWNQIGGLLGCHLDMLTNILQSPLPLLLILLLFPVLLLLLQFSCSPPPLSCCITREFSAGQKFSSIYIILPFFSFISNHSIPLFRIRHHQSVLPKGRSFTANSGTKTAVLLKGRSSTAT